MVFRQIFVSGLRIGAVQAERVYIFVQWKFVKIKMRTTFAYVEYANGKWYHPIELADSFLLNSGVA